MAWSEKELEQRLRRRAEELGMTFAELLAKAGMQRDAFRPDRPLRTARRIETLEALARACEWTLAEACGFDVLSRINPALAEDAYRMCEEALAPVLSPTQLRAVLWQVFARVYELLTGRERIGEKTTDRDRELIKSMIRREFRDRPPPPAPTETAVVNQRRGSKPEPA